MPNSTRQLTLSRFEACLSPPSDCQWFLASDFWGLHGEEDRGLLDCAQLVTDDQINWSATFTKLGISDAVYERPRAPRTRGLRYQEYYCLRLPSVPEGTDPSRIVLRRDMLAIGPLQGDFLVSEQQQLKIPGVYENRLTLSLREPYELADRCPLFYARESHVTTLHKLCIPEDGGLLMEFAAHWTARTFIKVSL